MKWKSLPTIRMHRSCRGPVLSNVNDLNIKGGNTLRDRDLLDKPILFEVRESPLVIKTSRKVHFWCISNDAFGVGTGAVTGSEMDLDLSTRIFVPRIFARDELYQQ
jgi:hypothetical protein